MEFDENGDMNDEPGDSGLLGKVSSNAVDYSDCSPEELDELLDAAITDENYEKASEIRDEIKKRKS